MDFYLAGLGEGGSERNFVSEIVGAHFWQEGDCVIDIFWHVDILISYSCNFRDLGRHPYVEYYCRDFPSLSTGSWDTPARITRGNKNCSIYF